MLCTQATVEEAFVVTQLAVASTSSSDCDKENKVPELKSLCLWKMTVSVIPQEIKKASKGLVLINTETSTRWAVKNFNDWAINKMSIYQMTQYH